MIADIMTKAVAAPQVITLRTKLGITVAVAVAAESSGSVIEEEPRQLSDD